MDITFHRPRQRRGPRSAFVLLPLVLFGCMFFGGSYLLSPEPDVEVQRDVGFATVNGREAALLPYERSGSRGMFQLMFRDMFQVRLAAMDLRTGERLWDIQLSDKLLWNASVLAAGKTTAYVSTDAGLVAVSLANGEVLAERAGFGGLGDSYVASRSAYAFDADRNVVVAMDATGNVHTIALDSLVTTPADAATAAMWNGKLSGKRPLPDASSTTAKEAMLNPTESLVLKDKPMGATLFRRVPGGRISPVGDTVFHNAQIVLERSSPRTAAGARSGHVLVQHERNVNDKTNVLSVVSLATGAVTDSLVVGSSRAQTVSDDKTAVTVATEGKSHPNGLAVVGADGRITHFSVGTSNVFGL
ncbi:PA2928 family protein [Allokutzneria oryzae]|uniref:PA2928 family protein n=1 Tax=Allokutzneria oryzae TaxID=1378989 RepID=A0ABV6A795_9PSEU